MNSSGTPTLPMDTPGNERIGIGKIVRAHGIRGEVKVAVTPELSEMLAPGVTVGLLREETTIGEAVIERIREGGGYLIVRLKGVEDRDSAEALAGSYLTMPRECLAVLGPDRYFVSDLIGMTVKDADGKIYGIVDRIEEYPANDVIIVDNGEEELYLPAVKDFVLAVNSDVKTIIAYLPEELPRTRCSR